MRNSILQNNLFLDNMIIVPVKGIQETDKDNMKELFGQSPYFVEFESTRKMAEEIYLLVTTTKTRYIKHTENPTIS